MSIRVILEVHLKPENVEAVKTGMRDLLPDTRAFEGCEPVKDFV
jgi:quinol monooxygenase YgiN